MCACSGGQSHSNPLLLLVLHPVRPSPGPCLTLHDDDDLFLSLPPAPPASAPPTTSPALMELKVRVDGIPRVVCGVTQQTTCQDVVRALAVATSQVGRFTLIEKFRSNER